MPLVPLSKMEMLELRGLRGTPVILRPALIVSLTKGPPTRVLTIDGTVSMVKETPEEIVSMIAAGGRKFLPGAAAYAKLKDALKEDELSSFISGDDGKDNWIEALKSVSYGNPRSKLLRMLGIYSEILSPFSFVKAFTMDFKKGALSPFEAEMYSKGFLRESNTRKGA